MDHAHELETSAFSVHGLGIRTEPDPGPGGCGSPHGERALLQVVVGQLDQAWRHPGVDNGRGRVNSGRHAAHPVVTAERGDEHLAALRTSSGPSASRYIAPENRP